MLRLKFPSSTSQHLPLTSHTPYTPPNSSRGQQYRNAENTSNDKHERDASTSPSTHDCPINIPPLPSSTVTATTIPQQDLVATVETSCPTSSSQSSTPLCLEPTTFDKIGTISHSSTNFSLCGQLIDLGKEQMATYTKMTITKELDNEK